MIVLEVVVVVVVVDEMMDATEWERGKEKAKGMRLTRLIYVSDKNNRERNLPSVVFCFTLGKNRRPSLVFDTLFFFFFLSFFFQLASLQGLLHEKKGGGVRRQNEANSLSRNCCWCVCDGDGESRGGSECGGNNKI